MLNACAISPNQPSTAGCVPALLPPGLPRRFTPRMDPVPRLGEHSEAILRELGYDDDTIARFLAEHVI